MSKAKPKPPPTLSASLRSAIIASGQTSYALGKAATVSPILIDRFLRGERDMRLATADKIVAALGARLLPEA